MCVSLCVQNISSYEQILVLFSMKNHCNNRLDFSGDPDLIEAALSPLLISLHRFT